jgi:hypothetical protein
MTQARTGSNFAPGNVMASCRIYNMVNSFNLLEPQVEAEGMKQVARLAAYLKPFMPSVPRLGTPIFGQ